MLSASGKKLGEAWLFLTVTLILHVFEEAIRHFLDTYKEIAAAIHAVLPGLPLPDFTFSSWITVLVVATAFLLLLAPFAYREQGPIRIYAKVFAVLMFLNGLSHLLGLVISGRVLPGGISSPLLIIYAFQLFRRAAARAPLQST